jgi:hypothetical protein
MDKNELPALFYWKCYQDGTVETNCPPPKEPPPSTEPHFYDYDTLIEESDGLYRDWWIMWKRLHPEWALIPEKELVVISPPQPKPTFKLLTCKRCNSSWTMPSRLLCNRVEQRGLLLARGCLGPAVPHAA